MNSNSNFKKNNSLRERLELSQKVLHKYPSFVPLIIEKNSKDLNNFNDLTKCKYLVPNELTISQLMGLIRKNIKVQPETAIFILINNTLISNSTLLLDVYNQFKDTDGFLYVTYTGENTFG